MIIITKAIIETIEKSTLDDLKEFVKVASRSANWYLLSDYCFDDNHKVSDVLTFSLLLSHDKIENIKKYISAFQPSDIKKSSAVQDGFLKYLISPVIYNFSFVLRKEDKYFAHCLPNEAIESFIDLLERDIENWIRDNPTTVEYHKSVSKRIKILKESKKAKSFNWKLMRKIMINSCIASIIFYEITKLNKPVSITWISDRDGIVEKFDGISLDLAFANLIYILANEQKNQLSIELSFLPKIRFLTSKNGTIDDFEELVRIPDFIAGMVAELKGANYNFSHRKYDSIFYRTIVNTNNHSIIAIDDKKDDFYIRRMKYI